MNNSISKEKNDIKNQRRSMSSKKQEKNAREVWIHALSNSGE